MWWLLLSLARAGEPSVEEGWYLWRTGRPEAAHAMADELMARGWPGVRAMPFVAAMAVDRGEGASFEAEVRDRWSETPDDPELRVGLAWAVSLRHAEEGAWCDEVEALLAKVTEGDVQLQAVLADRQKGLRCDGSTEHAEAGLRRLAKQGVAGGADALMGTLRAGYYNTGLAERVEALWAAEPHRLADAGWVFADTVAGPEQAAVRKVTKKALEDAAASEVPAVLHAAWQGYQGMGKDKDAAEVAARLAALDPQARLDAPRSLDELADPPTYAAIEACTRSARLMEEALRCLEKVSVPAEGGQAAARFASMRVVLEALQRPDDAYAAARSAYTADPTNRFNARLFAERALARGADAELAAAAAGAVLAGKVPAAVDEVPEPLRPARAEALTRWARAELAAGQAASAVTHLELALRLQDVPERRLWFGRALGAAGQADDAVLVLAYGLAAPPDAPGLVGESRVALDALVKGWHPGGLKAALAEVGAKLGGGADPSHPLRGKPLPEVVALPVREGEPAAATVIVLWAAWRAPSVAALQRVAGIGAKYAEKGVRVVAVDVGREAGALPEGVVIDTVRGSAAWMRGLQLFALPSAVLVGPDGKVVTVLPGYDSMSLELEEALDAFLPTE